MNKNRKNTIPVLMDIKYKYPINRFEEFYGDHVNYSQIEQESYIDLKNMVFEKVSKNIKFRKFNREKKSLTLKADMIEKEFELFKDILANKIIDEKATKDKKSNPSGDNVYVKFNFLHDFIIVNVKIMTKEDLIKAKKTLPEDEEDKSVKPTFVELDEDMVSEDSREVDFE